MVFCRSAIKETVGLVLGKQRGEGLQAAFLVFWKKWLFIILSNFEQSPKDLSGVFNLKLFGAFLSV